jgi:phosphopantetheinyl transferase (holo-ACP synthase)
MMPWADLYIRHDSYEASLNSASEAAAERRLSAAEREVLKRLKEPRRRRTWLCGRLCLKELSLSSIRESRWRGSSLRADQIEIHSLDILGRPTRPRVIIDGRLQPWNVSIAHTERSVLAALSFSAELSVGVDLTTVGAMSDGFRGLWLTAAERRWCDGGSDPHLASTLWAVKEAMYKAVNRGESFAPAAVEVARDSDGYTCAYKNRRIPRAPAVRVSERDGEVAAVVAVDARRMEAIP